MKKVEEVVGVCLVFAGVLLGVYVGVWICFIGGVASLVEQMQSPPVEPFAVAVDVARVFFAVPIGGAIMSVLVFIGGVMSQ